MRMRSSLLALALGGSVVALPVASATAGTITVRYALTGGSLDFSGPHVSPTAGGVAKFFLIATQAFSGATFGTIYSAYVSGLTLMGTDPFFPTRQTWTLGAGIVGPPGPAFFGFFPYLSGYFYGLNASGTGFTSLGGFKAKAYLPAFLSVYAYATHGVYGPTAFPGIWFVYLYGSDTAGTGYACFNAFTAPGACTLFTPFSPPFSATVPVPPGFNVVGAEVARAVSIPEPRLWLLLGSGIAGLLVIGRGRMRA